MKNKILIWCICVIIYAFSFLQVYTFMQKIYSKEGKLSNSDADLPAVFFTVAPGFNTVVAVVTLFISPYMNEPKIDYCNKFFNIKR